MGLIVELLRNRLDAIRGNLLDLKANDYLAGEWRRRRRQWNPIELE